MGWIGDEVAERLRAAFDLGPASPPAPADRPDPLDGIDYPVLPFVRGAFGLTFDDTPLVKPEDDGPPMTLARYVARQRPYWEQVSPAVLRAIFEETLPPRRWYGALLELL